MAQSVQRAVSDGTLVLLDLSINYLDRSEITVYFDSVLTTAWAWVGETAKQITFSPAVPNGVEVLVKRTTDISKLRHEFSLGAAFTAQSLDEDLKQVLQIAQEASEANLAGDFFVDIDMHNHRIRNIGTAVDDTDALTLGQYKADAAGAFAAKTAAANSASAAAASAANAANASRLTVGTVTTGDPGTDAAVSITGAAGAQVLNVTIPRGDVGPQGETGPQGPQGEMGPQGPAGDGSGNVVGPGPAVTTNALAQWSDTTGTVLKAVSVSGLVKLEDGVPSAAVPGTDYLIGNQTITFTGDATGSGETAVTLTLANSGVSAGTYRSVTVDAKGRVTAGTNPTFTGIAYNDGAELTAANASQMRAALGSATTGASGHVELATHAETIAGTDTTRAVTPAGLAAAIGAATGGLQIRAGSFVTDADGSVTVNFAEPFPTDCVSVVVSMHTDQENTSSNITARPNGASSFIFNRNNDLNATMRVYYIAAGY